MLKTLSAIDYFLSVWLIVEEYSEEDIEEYNNRGRH